jgi:hypothetical protein
LVFRRFANIGIFAKCLKQVEKKSAFGDFSNAAIFPK